MKSERKEAQLLSAPTSNHRKRSIARPYLWALVASTLLLTGCSAFKFMYGFAGNVIESRARGYLKMDTERRAELESQAKALITWHKRAMLPKYAAFLNVQAEFVEGNDLDNKWVSETVDGFRALVDETLEGASPFIARVLSDHTTEDRLVYLEDRMAEFVAEQRAEHETETPEDHLSERVDRQVTHISRFVGQLDDNQVAIIRGHLQNRSRDRNRWLSNREKRNAALVSFLRTQPELDEIAKFVHRIVLRSYEITDPDYKSHSHAYWSSLKAMYSDLATTLSDKQRSEFVSALRGYAADMTDLSVGS